MALIKSLRGKTPRFGNNCFLAENSTIVGDVTLGDDCSVWFNAVIRGDVNSITIGNKVNLQDGVIVHCTYQKAETVIGNNVSVGHSAIIHGCTIEDNVLIGMGAIIMDKAVIGRNSLIAAGAVVTENMTIEANSIYAGVPARKIKSIDENQFKGINERIADNYVMYAAWYKEE